jgi:hypothetical protein
MKYHVATIVSVLLGALLIGAAYVQTQRAEHRALILRTSLSKMDIRRLTNAYWECQPKQPGEPYSRDAVYCGAVSKALGARVSEVPALQVIRLEQHMFLPDINEILQDQPPSIRPRKFGLPTPQDVIDPNPPNPISTAAL